MIINESVNIKGHPKNLSYYKSQGFILNVGETISIDPIFLSHGSTIIVNCKCDNCEIIKSMQFREYYSNTKGLSSKYYCISCKTIRSRETCIVRYGVDNPMKNESIKNTLKESIFDKYGVDHYSKTNEYKEKYKSSCIDKYGVDNVSKSEDIKKIISNIKFKSSNSIEKYRDILSDEYEILEYQKIDKIEHTRVLEGIGSNRNFRLYHNICESEFEIYIGTISDRIRNKNIICLKCNPIDKLQSSGELELKKFIIDNGFKIVENSYDIIKPLSLDIYIPELKIAFEFNGIYWHSEAYRDKDYHIVKTKDCEKLGIKLLHIWEDDWVNKQDIIKSMILNKLGSIKNRIYARKCQIREVTDVKIIRKFLNENHIQGYSSSSIKIGLYFNDELVSLMIFGKKRSEVELIRFCNKLNTNVVGGSSKLFCYFIKNHNIDSIISYSDISFFNGGMYEKLGFSLRHITKPNYWWVVDGIRKHRFNFTKKKISRNNENLTESEIMCSHGHKKLWGCGLKKWIWVR